MRFVKNIHVQIEFADIKRCGWCFLEKEINAEGKCSECEEKLRQRTWNQLQDVPSYVERYKDEKKGKKK